MDGQPPAQISLRRVRGLAASLADAWCRGTILPVCALLALTLVAYLPALDAGFVFDDSIYVTTDARMESADGLRRIWTEVGGPEYRHQYCPLTTSGFWVQHQLWGQNPFGYHLVNVLLHALNAVLLWRLLRRVGLGAAWLAAAIFAVHPVHVQSVAWISELRTSCRGSSFSPRPWSWSGTSTLKAGSRRRGDAASRTWRACSCSSARC